MNISLSLPVLLMLVFCAASSGDKESTQEIAETDGIGCPDGTKANGETMPEVSEAWCELKTNEGVVLHGPYRSWYPNGTLGTRGQLEKGKPVGRWYGWYESGAKEGEIVYEDGEIISEIYWTEEGIETKSPLNSSSE